MRKVAFLTLVFFFVSLFLIRVTASEYDPWSDLNDDGNIDIFDVVKVAEAYGTTGTPINKTALLLDLLDRVEALENTELPRGFIAAPAYDSGWISFGTGQDETITLKHNLNATEVFVYLIGSADMEKTHQSNYGFNWYPFLGGGGQLGTRWYGLNSTCIELYRGNTDGFSPVAWNYTRVMIWKISES